MKSKLAALALATTLAGAGGAARAESKLTTQVFTGSEPGLFVDATLVAGEKDAVLIDNSFTLADAHRLAAGILDARKNLTTVYVTHWHHSAAAPRQRPAARRHGHKRPLTEWPGWLATVPAFM